MNLCCFVFILQIGVVAAAATTRISGSIIATPPTVDHPSLTTFTAASTTAAGFMDRLGGLGLGLSRRLDDGSSSSSSSSSTYTTDCTVNENGHLVCTACRTDGTYCVSETLSYSTTYVMALTCLTSSGYSSSNNINNGGNGYSSFSSSNYQFCYTTKCSPSAYFASAASSSSSSASSASSSSSSSTSDACTCTAASLNGQTCSSCEFCMSNSLDYTKLLSAKPTDFMKLDCQISSTDSSSGTTSTMTSSAWSSSTCPTSWFSNSSSGGSSGGGLTAALVTTVVALALVVIMVFAALRKRCADGGCANLESFNVFQLMPHSDGAFQIPGFKGFMT